MPDQLEFNPLTLGDTPEQYVENEDGSVDISIVGETPVSQTADQFDMNLVEVMDFGYLGGELVEVIEIDMQSREKRDKQYEEGIRRTGLGDDAPGGAQFSGASKVVHPVMAEACVDFQSSTIKELFPPSGPVKTKYVGDMSRAQTERGKRKAEFMNWQLTTEMPEYYDELEQLLSQLPLGGAQYLKVRYDSDKGRPVAEFVPIDEVLVPYAATSFYTASRVTHRQLITRQMYEDRVASGLYFEARPLAAEPESPDQTASSQATDKVEGVEETSYNEDGLRAILEVYTWRKFEDDPITGGELAPYIIHVDEHTETVLGVYRNWDEQDVTFSKLDWLVEWKFIPWRGAYGIGLPHLIGGLSAALTGALRALLDSAHINNAPSMLKLKTGRTVGSNTSVNITEVTEIEAPPNTNDIRAIAMPMPFNQPSPVLFQLLGFLSDAAKGVVTTAEEKIADAGNQMPVGTAMALIEQGSKVFSAIHSRLHRSQSKVLEILHRINSKYVNEDSQRVKLGKVLATAEDFLGSMDVVPASDPNVFSEAQRYAQMQALLQMSQDPRVQWNVAEIYQRMLELMKVPQADKLLPKIQEPLTADPLVESNYIVQGKPVKPEVEQDHMAHMVGHLAFLEAPWIIQNPILPPQVCQTLMAHVNEHLMMYQAVMMGQNVSTATKSGIMAEAGMQMGEEALIARTMAETVQQLGEALKPIMAKIGQLQQMVAQKQPPAQMPPEVQASLQIAQMDTQRKAEYDKGMLQIKQQELQQKQQSESASLQMEQQATQFRQMMEENAQRFDQMLRQAEQQAAARNELMSQQISLLINQQDNRQHQVTELLKNREDNQTALVIEEMKQHSQRMDAVDAKLSELLQNLALPLETNTPE